MSYLNFITNVCALLLWFNWIAIRYATLSQPTGVSLAGTLRRAESDRKRQWGSLILLVALLLFRAFLYYLFQSKLWLNMGIFNIWFHPVPGFHSLFQMGLFSLLSFVISLGAVYSWLALLSTINFQMPDGDPMQKIVRLHFRSLEALPRVFKLLLPFVGGTLFWLALQPLLTRMGIAPKTHSWKQLFEQSAWIGLSAYLLWKYLIVGVLLVHLLNSYVYLGKHPFWGFINSTARNLLLPLSWIPLRVGKVDFLPVAGIALIFLGAEGFRRLPYSWLPF